MKRMTIIGAVFAVCCAAVVPAVAAMPTQEELDKADALVQEVMKAEMDALRSGKKTREQVGDAAVALAKAAQAPAEKYILLTGAFDYYMRGGAYDKAASALEAVRKAIPDWKGSDEFALIDKAMRVVAFGKGGPVRERYEELKERQQYASRLKKVLAQAKAKPSDKKLQFQVATYSAALGHWPQAVDAFLAANNPACAAAAKLEKESAPPAKIADAWWSVVDIRPTFLSSAIRAHAVDLYKKALASNSLAGLQKVAAEKRIAEVESAAESLGDSSPQTTASSSASVGTAKYYGVELIGGSVKENKGILSDFANGSYAKLRASFDPRNQITEAVVEFETGHAVDKEAGLLCAIQKCGFAPFYIVSGQLTSCLSTNGETWDIARSAPAGIIIQAKSVYRIKVVWDGREYSLYLWENNRWQRKKSIVSSSPVLSGTDLLLGTNRLFWAPFSGTINLNKCYICIDGKLWWEGVKGAYKNANK